jgi:hypothetical protein
MKPTPLRFGLALALLLPCGLLRPGVSPAAHTKAETNPPPADTTQNDQKHDDEFSTPKGALRAYDASLPAGGIDAALAVYHADNDQERRAARALAEVDLATARVQQKVKEKFGPAAVDVFLHAARNVTQKDLDEADVKVDGDRATVIWKSSQPKVPMVKVDGKWRVSVAGVLANLGKDVDVDRLEKTCHEVTRELKRTGEELSAGEYPNLNLLQRAVEQRMYRVLGDE